MINRSRGDTEETVDWISFGASLLEGRPGCQQVSGDVLTSTLEFQTR